jgi:3-hydroxybutyryl-CoA dehydrogenase
MNPPHKLRFCEVVVRQGVAPETVDRSVAFLDSIDVQSIRCDDTAGFVLNSALVPFLMDAVRLLERGTASAEDIDLAFTAGCGHPMGPLAIIDLLGLDVTVKTAEVLHAELGPAGRCEPPTLLREVASRSQTFHPRRK